MPRTSLSALDSYLRGTVSLPRIVALTDGRRLTYTATIAWKQRHTSRPCADLRFAQVLARGRIQCPWALHGYCSASTMASLIGNANRDDCWGHWSTLKPDMKSHARLAQFLRDEGLPELHACPGGAISDAVVILFGRSLCSSRPSPFIWMNV